MLIFINLEGKTLNWNFKKNVMKMDSKHMKNAQLHQVNTNEPLMKYTPRKMASIISKH